VYNTPRKEDGLKKKKFKGFFFFFFTFFPYAQRILRRQLNSWSLFSRLSGLVYIHTNIYKGKHSPLFILVKRTSRGGEGVVSLLGLKKIKKFTKK
jgi:hypothetical protein